MTNITIGQFYPIDSLIHRLDPRVKLIGMIFYIISLFFSDNLWGYAIAALFLIVVISLSRVPPRYMFKGLKAVLFILFFAAALNILLTPGEQELFSFFFLRATWEGVSVAGKMALRLVLLIVGSAVLTLTTSPIRLTDAIEYLLMPLQKIKIPAHEIAMMMTIALRFIPTLTEETDKIMKAQMARGADFDTGGLLKKARSLVPVLVPLFVSAFRRADELAVAMDARCYRGGENRTKMKEMHMLLRDYGAMVCLVLYGVMLFLTRYF